MFRVDRVSRRQFFEGWTPGWILGFLLYIGSILTLHLVGSRYRLDLTPCLFHQATGLPCPLCGGTTSAMHLFSGRFLSAIGVNPMVTILLLAAPFVLLWSLASNLRVRWDGRARPLLLGLLLFFVFTNWIYVAITQASLRG